MTKMTPTPLAPTGADCTAITALIPEYAFGLATDAERSLVETGLASCPEAAQQLIDFQQIQASLRAGVPQVAPPIGSESRLMAALDSAPSGSALPAAGPVTPAARKTRFNRAWLAVAAAVIALVVSNVYWAARVAALPGAQVPAGGFAVQNTAALRWARLPAAQQGGPGAAFLMWNAQSETGIICVWGLPKLEAGQTYRLWVTRGDVTTSAGTVTVDALGRGALVFALDAPLDSYTGAYITAEMTTDNPAPAGPPVVTGKFPA